VGELVVAVQMGFGMRQLPGALRRRSPAGGHRLRGAELERLGRRGVSDLALMAACKRSPADAHHLGDEEFVVVLGPALGRPRAGGDARPGLRGA
jgi:hypothetical protein